MNLYVSVIVLKQSRSNRAREKRLRLHWANEAFSEVVFVVSFLKVHHPLSPELFSS